VQNRPVGHAALGSAADSANRAAIVNQMLQGVTQYGTGTAAALPGREVAGKTGTTENYGDAWFVGYTPQLVAAIWVGYPDKLVPMTTDFHGHPVEGGTYPALIWKAFMSKALPFLGDDPEDFSLPSIPYASPETLVNVNDKLEVDNGNCRNGVQVEVFSGEGPGRTADCKANAVDVPDVIGETVGAARLRLSQQPLKANVVYRPAKPGEKTDVVAEELPKNGTLSSWSTVMFIVPKRVKPGTAG
jgi:membrane peptidoglycan carboxypeptidase